MKKLNKLSINPEKVIKNEELTNLRGGYDPGSGSSCWYCNVIYRDGWEQSGLCCGPSTPSGCEIRIYDANSMWDVACE